MDELINDFEKLSKIVSCNSNSHRHSATLYRLVRFFHKKHSEEQDIDNVREVSILTEILVRRIRLKYGAE